jgi:hypothetical protein
MAASIRCGGNHKVGGSLLSAKDLNNVAAMEKRKTTSRNSGVEVEGQTGKALKMLAVATTIATTTSRNVKICLLIAATAVILAARQSPRAVAIRDARS